MKNKKKNNTLQNNSLGRIKNKIKIKRNKSTKGKNRGKEKEARIL